MNKIAIVLVLVATLSSVHGAPLRRTPLQERQQRQQQRLQPSIRPNAAQRRALVEDAVLGFYVNQFQQVAEVSPEVFSKILPFLQQFVQDRFEISQRRTRALNQLRRAIESNGPEEDLRRLMRELDATDAEFQSNQEKFLNNVDPLLSARQQAKVRILQNMADNRIRQMLNAVQNPANQRQGAPPQVPPQN